MEYRTPFRDGETSRWLAYRLITMYPIAYSKDRFENAPAFLLLNASLQDDRIVFEVCIVASELDEGEVEAVFDKGGIKTEFTILYPGLEIGKYDGKHSADFFNIIRRD